MYYGPISGCFDSALTLNTYAAPTSTGSRCFAWACDGDGMHILLARKWVLCTGDEDEPYTAGPRRLSCCCLWRFSEFELD